MSYLLASLYAENLKIRKSKVLLFSLLGCIFISSMIGIIIFISMHPELFNNNSLLSTKATLFTIHYWNDYLSLILQMTVFMGFIFYGFLMSWVFGREYSDRTLKDLLALPVSRSTIITSKFIVTSFWSFILSLILFTSSLIVGKLINLQNWSSQIMLQVLFYYILASILAIIITTPVALVASIGKGYLAPIAFMIAVAVLSQFINSGLPGLDPYVPWILPAIVSQIGIPASSSLPALNIISYILFFGTSLIGIFGTMYWWSNTDQD